MRPHQTALVLAGIVSFVGLLYAPVGRVLLPLDLLNTHLHELSHALAALLTGGMPQHIYVFRDGSGLTPSIGGIRVIVSSAGYLGAAAAGAGMVYAVKTETASRWALWLTSSALTLSLIFLVRGDFVGVLSGIVWAVLLFLAARFLNGPWLSFTVALLGLQQGLNAIRSLTELLQISAVSEAQSDARNMQDYTLIPAIVWAGIWAICGLGVILFTVRRTWGPMPGKRRPPAK